MESYRLFYEDHQHAIQSAIDNNARGLTFKQVACEVYPHLKPESSYARLKAIVNPEKDEKADLQEIRQVCLVCARFEPLFWLCDVTDHARPAKRAPEDRQAQLIEEFNRSVQVLQKLATQIQAGPALKAVK
jgi:hypothetical protein